jgi:hypothetical protein
MISTRYRHGEECKVDDRTAPKVVGELEVTCEGVYEWCGKSIPIRVELNAGLDDTRCPVVCPTCGAEARVIVRHIPKPRAIGAQVK